MRVVVPDAGFYALQDERGAMGDMMPELALGQLDAIEVDPRSDADLEPLKELAEPSIVTVKNGLDMEPVHAFRLLASRIEDRHLILLKDTLAPGSVSGEDVPLVAARNAGSLLCDGIGDALLVQGESDPRLASFLAFNILQATGMRLTRADYVSCPSCGRHPVQYSGGDGPHPQGHGTFEGGEDCRDGVHRERAGRDGGRRLRVCGGGSEQD